MSIKTRSVLKTDKNNTFTTNSNQEITGLKHRDYLEDLLDSLYNKSDESWIDHDIYSTTKSYGIGDIVTNGFRLLICRSATSGSFDASKWEDIGWNTVYGEIPQVTVTAGDLDLAGNDNPVVIVTNTGSVSIDTITGGVHGRTYKIIPITGCTDMTINHTAKATAISTGIGQVACNGQANVSIGAGVGNNDIGASDYFEVRYFRESGAEYCIMINHYKG